MVAGEASDRFARQGLVFLILASLVPSLREERAMQQASIEYPSAERPEMNEPDVGVSRLRTVTGNRFPRKCSCGCGREIPRDPQIRYVVDFGAPKPYPNYLREHSPDFGSYRGRPRARQAEVELPGFVPASTLRFGPPARPSSPPTPRPEIAVAQPGPHATPSPEASRAWSCGQLVFNAGSFESARSGFADYARPGETGEQLRARVNRVILEDLEQKVIALRALHEKLRDVTAGPSFGDMVARSRPA
jgi:hypothetical protein